MPRRKLYVILGVLAVTVAAGLEWASWFWSAGMPCVMIVNEGDEPMQGVHVTYADTHANLGKVDPGEKSKVWFSAAGRGVLQLDFTQKGNPLAGFKVNDFDPLEHRRDGSRLVLVVNGKQVERYVEADETVKTPPKLLDRLIEYIRDELR
jgi:hypothetical protein